MATFVNEKFSPKSTVTAEQISFTSGATALINVLARCILEENEGILLGMPIYGSFVPDLQTMSKYGFVEIRSQYN
jgi:aspartate/methionine/tyrosine aminotransferase